jgi:WD40 repeat protein
MSHGTFEVTFYPAPSGAIEFPTTAIYRPAETRNLAVQRVGGVFRHDESLQRQLLDAQIDHRDYGLALGRTVFQGPVQGLFLTALGDTPPGEPLHVLLALEAVALRELRWERLLGPWPGEGEWDFLALNQRTTLAVYVAGATQQKFPPVGLGAINVLLVVACPQDAADAPPFDVPGAAAAVVHGLGDRVKVLARNVPGASGLPSLEQLLIHLTRERFTVLHIVAHGTYAQEVPDFCLILEKPAGTADRVPGKVLLRELRRLSGKAPYLTFLSACESARPGLAAHDRFADQLAREAGLPAVIGMADPLSVATAAAVATPFYSSLRRCGRPDVALSEARAGLVRADDALVPVLVSQLGGRPLFDEQIDTPPADAAAVERGLRLLEQELHRRAPSLLGEFGRYRAQPPRPGEAGWTEALTELNNWADEAVGVTFNGLCAGIDPPPYRADMCPFNGMKPFDFSRRAYFKARETLVETLVARLRAERALGVVGPSGSGKSSVVFAGVLPHLGLNPDGFVKFAPGADPLAALAAAVDSANSPNALVVVDQFEELFTHPQTDSVRADFLGRLKAEQERRPVVITMRSEFRDGLRDTWLWGLVADPQRDIAPMPSDDLRRATEEQAAEVGLKFEANLVSLVLDDVGDEPGRMPLLQHTLRELWRRRCGVWLKTAEYRELGGVREAVARTADAVVNGLGAEDHRRATDLLLRLTRVADEADITNQTRRRVRIADLVPFGEDEGPTRGLLTRLVNEYLVVTAGNTAEVAHEALIRHWSTLGEWVAAHRPALLVRQAVAGEARSWDQDNRRRDGLMRRGAKLDEASALRNHQVLRLNALETAYLGRCAQEQKSQQRLRWWTRIGAVAAGVLLVVALGWAAVSAKLAEKSKEDLANTEKKRADDAEQAKKKADGDAVIIRKTSDAARAARGATLGTSAQLLLSQPTTPETTSVVAAVAVTGWRLQPTSDAWNAMQRVQLLHRAGAHSAKEGTPFSHAVARVEDLSLVGFDGNQVIVSGSSDETIDVLFKLDRPIVAMAVSPDSKTVAVSDQGGTTYLSRLEAGTKLRALKPVASAHHLAFSLDGTCLATLGAPGAAQVWRVDDGSLQTTLPDRTTGKSLALSPHGEFLALADESGTVIVVSVATGRETARIDPGQPKGRVQLAFDPGGHLLTVAGAGRVRVVAVEGGQELAKTEYSTSSTVTLCPDGRYLAIVSRPGPYTYRIDLTSVSGNDRVTMAANSALSGCRFSPDGRAIVITENQTSGGGGIDVAFAYTFDGADREVARLAQAGPLSLMALSEDGTLLATGYEDGHVVITNVADSKQLGRWAVNEGHGRQPGKRSGGNVVLQLTISLDGKSMAASGADGAVCIWSRDTPNDVRRLRTKSGVLALGFADDGSRLRTVDGNGQLRLYTLSGEEVSERADGSRRTSNRTSLAALSPTGEAFAALDEENGYVRELPSGRLLRRFPADAWVDDADYDYATAVAVSPRGEFVAIGHKESGLRIFATTGDKPMKSLNFDKEITGAVFSRDGALLFVAVGDGTTHVLNVPDWHEVARVNHGKGPVAVAVAGTGFATAGNDGSIRVWSRRWNDMLTRLCQDRGQNLSEAEWDRYLGDLPRQPTSESWPARR